MLNLLSPTPIATESYIKVIIIKLDDFLSEIIDEHNFGLNNISQKDEFKNLYQGDDIICLERIIN
jgi:hypothetical protein